MARYRNSNLVVRSHWSQCQMAACRRRPCVWPCSSFRLLRLIGRTYGLGCSFGLIFVNNFQNVKIKRFGDLYDAFYLIADIKFTLKMNQNQEASTILHSVFASNLFIYEEYDE